MLASTPASILNHKTAKNGIPSDSAKIGSALEAAIPFLGPASIVDLLVLTALNRKRGRY